MLKAFRILSLIEGLSLVILLFIAMPAKYYFGISGVVPIAGITHGGLWLTYVVMSLLVSHKQQWSVGFWLLTLLVSVMPFMCIWLERRLQQQVINQNTD
jgi:integral membrane protein